MIKELINIMPQVGTIEWIGLRSSKRATIQVVDSAIVDTEIGLTNDHYSGKSGNRQVTLIMLEHLQVVSSILGKEKIDPALARRNFVTKGINLLALKNKKFQVGECLFEMTGICHPCSRMEENFGPGGYNAIRGHSGITARVILGGTIRRGDSIRMLPE